MMSTPEIKACKNKQRRFSVKVESFENVREVLPNNTSRLLSSEKKRESPATDSAFLCPQFVRKPRFGSVHSVSEFATIRRNSALHLTPVGRSNKQLSNEEIIKLRMISPVGTCFERISKVSIFKKQIEYADPSLDTTLEWRKQAEPHELRRNSYLEQDLDCFSKIKQLQTQLTAVFKGSLVLSNPKETCKKIDYDSELMCYSQEDKKELWENLSNTDSVSVDSVNDNHLEDDRSWVLFNGPSPQKLIELSRNALILSGYFEANQRQHMSEKVVRAINAEEPARVTFEKPIEKKYVSVKKVKVSNFAEAFIAAQEPQVVVKDTKKKCKASKKKSAQAIPKLKAKAEESKPEEETKPKMEDSSKTISTQATKSGKNLRKRKSKVEYNEAKLQSCPEEETNKKRRSQKALRKRTADTSERSDESWQGLLPCNHWGRLFTAQGLGGHKAKAHQGLNVEYKKKLEIRNKNKIKLSILREAQERFRREYNKPGIKNVDMPRNVINKLKKQIADEWAVDSE